MRPSPCNRVLPEKQAALCSHSLPTPPPLTRGTPKMSKWLRSVKAGINGDQSPSPSPLITSPASGSNNPFRLGAQLQSLSLGSPSTSSPARSILSCDVSINSGRREDFPYCCVGYSSAIRIQSERSTIIARQVRFSRLRKEIHSKIRLECEDQALGLTNQWSNHKPCKVSHRASYVNMTVSLN